NLYLIQQTQLDFFSSQGNDVRVVGQVVNRVEQEGFVAILLFGIAVPTEWIRRSVGGIDLSFEYISVGNRNHFCRFSPFRYFDRGGDSWRYRPVQKHGGERSFQQCR